MIVLDTNVLSELSRHVPDPGVFGWLDSLEISAVATTADAAAELRCGVTRLPEGHRRRELTVMIRGILAEDFYGRILPFDKPEPVTQSQAPACPASARFRRRWLHTR